ncbi:MAG: hypothetical protein LBR36_10075 [Bacteroidales bacterium]|jgi:hypothetical protein|nr:hypothetical protein [Bacteroidales bacterium]
MKAIAKKMLILGIAIFMVGGISAQINKGNARNFLNKTSFIIGEAYDMVYYYNYYTSGYLAKAVNHQNYAKYLYSRGQYRNSIIYSNIARNYALKVIYDCDNYWNNYYRPTYYNYYGNYHSHSRPSVPQSYGNDKRPTPSNAKNRPVNNAPRNSASGGVSAINNNGNVNGNIRSSKYEAGGPETGGAQVKAFDNWSVSYYSDDEMSIVKGMPSTTTTELEKEVERSSNITRVSDDKAVIDKGISDYKSDISTYKSAHAEEAREITISRPQDFGTTPEVTRSTAGKIVVPTNAATATEPAKIERSNASDARINNTQEESQAKVKIEPIAQPQRTEEKTVSQPVKQTTTQPVQQTTTQPARSTEAVKSSSTSTTTNKTTSTQTTQPAKVNTTTTKEKSTSTAPATNSNTGTSTNRSSRPTR